MALKITPEDYEVLKAAIAPLAPRIQTHRKSLEAVPGVRDTEKRIRWDLLHASKVKIGDGVGMHGDVNLYAYLNDDHIDSALKKIVAELEDSLKGNQHA